MAAGSVSFVVIRKPGIAGPVTQIVDTTPQGVVFDLPVARIERLPFVSVIQGIRPLEFCRPRGQAPAGCGCHRSRCSGTQKRSTVQLGTHRSGIVAVAVHRLEGRAEEGLRRYSRCSLTNSSGSPDYLFRQELANPASGRQPLDVGRACASD